MEKDNCPMCNYAKRFNVIWENRDCVLAYDNYGIDYSHTLLFAKTHCLCFQGNYDLIEQYVKKIVSLYKIFFNEPVVLYEHGNTLENISGEISIDHAHLHFLRCSYLDKFLEFPADKKDIVDFSTFYKSNPKSSYHMLSFNMVETNVIYDKLESQQFRKHFVTEQNEWDWKVYGNEIMSRNLCFGKEKKIFKEYMQIALKEK